MLLLDLGLEALGKAGRGGGSMQNFLCHLLRSAVCSTLRSRCVASRPSSLYYSIHSVASFPFLFGHHSMHLFCMCKDIL